MKESDKNRDPEQCRVMWQDHFVDKLGHPDAALSTLQCVNYVFNFLRELTQDDRLKREDVGLTKYVVRCPPPHIDALGLLLHFLSDGF